MGMKNASNETMLQKLVSIYNIEERFGKITDNSDIIPVTTRKEPQCHHRLMNIFLSDRFAEGFVQLGNVADQAALDAGELANNQLFWEGVQEAFEGQDEECDNIHFADDEVFGELHYTILQKEVPYSWVKLWSMWKRLNSEYKAALSHFTMSGMHLFNFYKCCKGWHEIYYLRKDLESKPNLVSNVVADLPEEVFVESI